MLTVTGSVFVFPTVTLPNWSRRPCWRQPIGVGLTQETAGVAWILHTGVATEVPSSCTVSCGRDGSLESNSSVPLSLGLVSPAGGEYCTVEVNASPGRSVIALVGGEMTLKNVAPAVILTAVRLQSARPRLATVTSRCALCPRTTCPNETCAALASRRQAGG